MSSPSTEQLLNRLRLRQVALLLAIGETRTLRNAAFKLGMTQPAASKMLRELEDAFGEPLFERVGRGLKFTPTGEAVLTAFRGLRNGVASLSRELHELPLGGSGRLLIGSISATSSSPLSDATIRLKQRYPLLSVEIHVDTSDRLIELLRAGKLDLVIGRMPEPGSRASRDCIFRPIGEEALALVCACNHPVLREAPKKKVSFEALQHYPWIFPLPGSPLREVIEQEFHSHHVPLPQGLIETSSFMTVTGLVAQSEMIAVIPKSVAAVFTRHGLLRGLPYAFTNSLSPWGSLVFADRPISPIMQTTLDLLHAADDGR